MKTLKGQGLVSCYGKFHVIDSSSLRKKSFAAIAAHYNNKNYSYLIS